MDSEKYVLGQMLMNNDIVADSVLKEEDFETADHRRIYKAILWCLEQNIIADIITVIKADPGLPVSYVATLTDIGSTANWEFYAKEVVEASKKRRLGRLASQLKDWLVEGDSDEVMTKLETGLADIAVNTDKDKIYGIAEIIPDYIGLLEERYKNKAFPGISTGFPALDERLVGFRPRMLYYVGGRPSEGKSALLLNFATKALLRSNKRVGFLSAESSKEELLNRIFADVGSINSILLSTGALGSKSDFENLTAVATKLFDTNLFFYDKPNMTLLELKTYARRLVRAQKCDILFVDYVQLIKNDGFDQKRDSVAEVSIALKALARELEVPIVTAAQLRRDVQGKRPTLADFCDTSQIEKDADVAMMLYHTEEADKSYICCEKVRDGQTGNVPVGFNRGYARFYERSGR